MSKVVCIFLVIFLIGCEDKSQKKEIAKENLKSVQELDKKLYILQPAPKVEVNQPKVVEPPLVTPVEFPEPLALVREEQARVLRGKRQEAFKKTLYSKSTKVKHFRLKDEDYRQWEPMLPENKSTFPVDRSRILTTDMRIGAVLEDNINSQIAGKVIAVVDRNLLSPNGKYILLPAYTKIICNYEGLEKTGETRLQVNCTRVLRPDGTSVVLTQAISSDQMGRTGLIGEVAYM